MCKVYFKFFYFVRTFEVSQSKKNVKFHWLSKDQEAFDYLKQALSEPCVLAYFDHKAETDVVVNATPIGLGALVLQKQSSGDLQLLSIANRALSDEKEDILKHSVKLWLLFMHVKDLEFIFFEL